MQVAEINFKSSYKYTFGTQEKTTNRNVRGLTLYLDVILISPQLPF